MAISNYKTMTYSIPVDIKIIDYIYQKININKMNEEKIKNEIERLNMVCASKLSKIKFTTEDHKLSGLITFDQVPKIGNDNIATESDITTATSAFVTNTEIVDFVDQTDVKRIVGTIAPSNEELADCISLLSEDFSNLGTRWKSINNTNYSWNSLAMSSSGRHHSGCTQDGKICRSEDYGQIWNLASINPATTGQIPFTSISMSSTGQYQIASLFDKDGEGNGYVYKSINYGSNWNIVNSLAIASWSTVAVSASGKYMTACTQDTHNGIKGIYISKDYGVTWTQSQTLVEGVTRVVMSASGRYQYVISGKEIYRSIDFGVTWTSIFEDQTSIEIKTIATSSTGKYLLFCINYLSDSIIYTSSDYGETTKVTNASSSFTDSRISATGQYQIVTIFSNIIFTSDDYGISWNEIDMDPWIPQINVVSMSASGRYIMLGKQNENLLYSVTDNARLFTTISIEADSNPIMGSMYFNGTNIVVYNGTSWITIANVT